VAEGVETEEQLTALRRLGCPMAQGYLFSSPQPAERVEAMLAMSGSGHPHPALMLCPDEPAAPPAHLAQ
jgi:predicted signal transduction protein with EAL and GGDEF domain